MICDKCSADNWAVYVRFNESGRHELCEDCVDEYDIAHAQYCCERCNSIGHADYVHCDDGAGHYLCPACQGYSFVDRCYDCGELYEDVAIFGSETYCKGCVKAKLAEFSEVSV